MDAGLGAPAALRFTREATLEAEWYPPGDAEGFLNWGAFSSPCIVRADAADAARLTAGLTARPLLTCVRKHLQDRLAPGKPLHTVSLFRGRIHASDSSEVQIDGAIIPELGLVLSERQLSEIESWGFVRQHLVLIRSTPSA